jgi:hypothetical protein
MTDTTPTLIKTIRRDLERSPHLRGGAVHFNPATPGIGGLGMPGDNVVTEYQEALDAGTQAQTALAAIRAIHTRTEVEAVSHECSHEEGTCEHGTPGHPDDCPTVQLGVCAGCMTISDEMGGFDETIPGTIVWPCPTIKAIEAVLA